MHERLPQLGAASLALLLGACVGVGGYTFWYAQGASYLSNDPRACVNCHIMRDQYDFIGKYMSKMLNGYHHSRAFTFQDFHEPIRIKPHNADNLEANCRRCHSEMVEQIDTHHAPEQQAMACVHCHRDVGHGPIR
jgi:cytochrome c nitrite reductase small subunit